MSKYDSVIIITINQGKEVWIYNLVRVCVCVIVWELLSTNQMVISYIIIINNNIMMGIHGIMIIIITH